MLPQLYNHLGERGTSSQQTFAVIAETWKLHNFSPQNPSLWGGIASHLSTASCLVVWEWRCGTEIGGRSYGKLRRAEGTKLGHVTLSSTVVSWRRQVASVVVIIVVIVDVTLRALFTRCSVWRHDVQCCRLSSFDLVRLTERCRTTRDAMVAAWRHCVLAGQVARSHVVRRGRVRALVDDVIERWRQCCVLCLLRMLTPRQQLQHYDARRINQIVLCCPLVNQ